MVMAPLSMMAGPAHGRIDSPPPSVVRRLLCCAAAAAVAVVPPPPRTARAEPANAAASAAPAPAPAMRSAGKPAGFPTPRFAPPPRLAITADELAAVRSSPDFGKIRAAAVAAADPLVDKPIPLPDGPGSWIFYYANPENGNPLTPLSPLEHKDPKTGQVFNDARTVAAYRGIMHSTLEAATVTLGWAYAYTGDEKYAAASLRIFRKLADDYATYPRRLDRWGRTGLFAPLGGRRMVQSLDEAFGMTRLAKGYDLVRNSATFTAADRRHVEEDFFRPTADTLLWFNQDINNHQTWYDAGLMCIASVLADERLVDRVLTMRGGFFDQLERAVGADGLWYEGTIAYHSYALQALIQQVDAGRRLGLPMHDHPRLKAMFTAPIHAAYPNGQVPAINDSDRADISMFNAAWEWAWKTYRDPVFAQAIAKGDQRKLDALMGAGAATARWPISLESEALMDAGLAVLRMGAGAAATCIFLDFGPHGGGHGHLDKLSLLLYANGREWLLDPGRLSYSHKEYKTWVKTTAAHNTVAIGSRSQAPATGRLVYLQQADGHAAAVAECNAAYPATMLRRHVLLTPTFCVDIFDVATDRAVQIDLFAHAVARTVEPAQPGLPAAAAAALGSDDGYQHLAGGEARTIAGDSAWDFTDGPRRLRVLLVGNADADEQVFTCRGIGYDVAQATPTLVRRRTAKQTRFVAVYDLSGDGTGVTGAAVVPGDRPTVTVDTPGGIFAVDFGERSATVTRR